MQHEQSNTQNNQELEPKPLFVGQINEEYIVKFRELMQDLSAGYESDLEKNNGDISCICNYNYFDFESTDLSDDGKLLTPESWIDTDIRGRCIEIVNHALKLAGYGEYLTHNQTELIEAHNICCSVNYYDNRMANQGFHQDSYGRELFVLLIYLDPVHGPEVKLKTSKEFQARMNYISKKEFMPKCFLTKVRELHEYAINQHGITIKWTGGTAELNENSVEWITPVNGPGGIVGFLDEMIIHATPHIGHRESNCQLLLEILEEMTDNKKKEWSISELKAITFLENTIQGIIKIDDNPISIYELQGIIEPNKQALAILGELYNRLGEFEGVGKLLLNILDLMRDTKEEILSTKELEVVQLLQKIISQENEHYLSINELYRKIVELQDGEDEELTRAINKILNKLYYKLGKLEIQAYANYDNSLLGLLGTSEHTIYKNSNTPGTVVTYHHTKSNQRRLSVKLNEGIPPLPQPTDDVKPSEKRSFLRVWVTAIKKKGD